MMMGTSFIVHTPEEEEIFEKTDFGKENNTKLETGRAIVEDASRYESAISDCSSLANTLNMNSFIGKEVTKKDIEDLERAEANAESIFKELKEKYKDFDFDTAIIELYDEK